MKSPVKITLMSQHSTFDYINTTYWLRLYSDKTSISRANMIRDFKI